VVAQSFVELSFLWIAHSVHEQCHVTSKNEITPF
jgi:hypothetical protein